MHWPWVWCGTVQLKMMCSFSLKGGEAWSGNQLTYHPSMFRHIPLLLFLSIHADSGKQVNDNRRVHPVDLVCEDHWRAIPLVSNVGMITTVLLFSYPSKTSSAGVRKMTSFAYWTCICNLFQHLRSNSLQSMSVKYTSSGHLKSTKLCWWP